MMNENLNVWTEQNSQSSSDPGALPPAMNPIMPSSSDEITSRNCK